MTDVVAPFELRRLQVRWQRSPAGGTIEDHAVVSFHLAKIVAGAIDAGWTAANMAACEARFDTYWAGVKVDYPAHIQLVEYRWFKDGPVFAPADRADGPPNPTVRSTARAVVGTGAAAAMLPPQVALTVTEKTSERSRWGRFYLPAALCAAWCDNNGRFVNTAGSRMTLLLALYNGWRADGFRPVVFSRERSAYVTPSGAHLAHHDATAYEVLSLQLDNLMDVVRTRRYDGATQKTDTALT